MSDNRACTGAIHTARDEWRVAASASLQSLVERADTPELLRRALTGTISWQTRNETSVGVALRVPHIAAQWVAALLPLGATVSTRIDEEEVVVSLETALHSGGVRRVSALHVPSPPSRLRCGEAHVARSPADQPIVAAVAAVEMGGDIVQRARVALIGVWSEPVRLAEAAAQLVGHPLDDAAIQRAAAALEQEVAPQGDFLGSEEYRRAMAAVLTRRALQACVMCQEAGNG